jgi:hypothetical protein
VTGFIAMSSLLSAQRSKPVSQGAMNKESQRQVNNSSMRRLAESDA